MADCPRSGRPSVSGDQITEISDAVTACYITVFVAVGYNFLLAPYFFEDGDGKPINVNGENYCAMLSDFPIPELKRRKSAAK